MTKHTPGPWKVAAIPGSVIALDNATIAKVFYGERSVCDANARLIAAAPDMLGACQLAFRLIGLGRKLTDEEATQGLQALSDAMRKAASES